MSLNIPFNRDKWSKEYFETIDTLLSLMKKNPYLTVSDVYPLVRLVDKLMQRLDENHQIALRIEQINEQHRKNLAQQ